MKPLTPDSLYHSCEDDQFSFKTTDELEPLEEIIGQKRALEALNFGLKIKQHGYNLYALGPHGLGKHSAVRRFLKQQAADETTPPDWCYVNNFDHPDKPQALQLQPGQGSVFRQDMTQLIDDLRAAIPAAFEAEEYQARVQEIEESLKEQVEAAFSELTKEAEQHDITMLRTPRGFAFAPVKNNEVLNPKEYQALPKDEQHRIEKTIATLEEKLHSIIYQQPQWQRQARQDIRSLNREITLLAAGHLISEIKKKYHDHSIIQQYLDAVQDDVIEHLDEFRSAEEGSEGLAGLKTFDDSFLHRYQVNVLVDNSKTEGAPVIYEDSPVFQNLVGAVEHRAQMGALVTDFRLIKPGALHLSNGGYLILDAVQLLTKPYAWEGLKRALSSQCIHIQSLGEIYSLVTTTSLKPEPIPLKLKVILVGDRMLYYLLQSYDPEFPELFKAAADFDVHMDRSNENNLLYARLIAAIAKKEQLRVFDRQAVARIIEHATRLAEDREKLSTHIRSIADLLREADYWANEADHDIVNREDVQQAIDKQIYRADRIRERVYEEIKRGTILIDTKGEKTGQINALSVIDLGQFAFAQPSRVTATARLGEGEVVDIERETELGGAIHSKGVFILSAFLAARYAQERPLSLSASLVFEQSYGMIEGDSASMAELCALLSVLARTPIKQSLAITGSVNQHGFSQPIGGVNEKIEGFFDVCKITDFTGDQGVIIPAANVKHLMLRHDVVEAVRQNTFHIYAVNNIDEAIELLTGVEAGTADSEGHYPENSINQRVEKRLIELENLKESFARAAKESGN